MNREQASKGYEPVENTSAHAFNFYGFTVTSTAVVSALVNPTGPGPEITGYTSRPAGLAGMTLTPGYYPIRGSSLTLTSGSAILWIE